MEQKAAGETLGVIIPAYNEGARIGATLQRVQEWLANFGVEYEILVVDDGSSDDTAKIVEKWERKLDEVRLLRQGRNQGKGAAVKRGMLEAKGDWRLFMDADSSTDIKELKRLWELRGKKTVVMASRYVKSSQIVRAQPWRRRVSSRVYNMIIKYGLELPYSDTQCGFKLFSSYAAEQCFGPLTRAGFDFDVEVLLRAKRLGFKIVEVGVRWENDDRSTVSFRKDGLSLLWGLAQLRWKAGRRS